MVLCCRIARRVREEAERPGFSTEGYTVEVFSRDLEPRDRALEYVEAAMDLLRKAREELKKDDGRQAAGKLWGAALALKAYATT